MSTSARREFSDRDLKSVLSDFANEGIRDRDSRIVAETAMRSRPRHLGWPVAAIVAVVVVGATFAVMPRGASDRDQGSSLPVIEIGGLQYRVSIGTKLLISSNGFTPSGTVDLSEGSRTNAMSFVSGTQAFSVPGVDPNALLVMPAASYLADRADDPIEFVLLIGPEPLPPAFCRYVDLGHPGAPQECN